jgi:flagellar biosynthesis/type III secretory pathway protein FliH
VTQTYSFPQLDSSGRRIGGPNTATERAAEIVAKAEARAVLIEAEAAERGYADGFARGLAGARERIEPGVEALAAASRALADARAQSAELLEGRAVELALALAEKIVSAALAARPELVVEIVRGALRRVADRDAVLLQVNPADLELVRASLDELGESLGGFERVELVGERRVPRGGCVVRTREGELDARAAEQLERAREVLADLLAPPADG